MLKKNLCGFLICFVFIFVQAVGSIQAEEADILAETKQDMLVVAGLGGAGAILGLSTLSFVDEPKDHLKNIVVGGAIGVIIGVGVVAWMQASKSQNDFNSAAFAPSDRTFQTHSRLAWHRQNHDSLNERTASAPGANFLFSF